MYNPAMKRYIRSGYRRPQPARRGYGTVARTRGWAGQGEMKYFDTEQTAVAIPATTTAWPAGAMVDPTNTVDLGDPAIATPLTLCVPKVSAALNGRIGRKIKVFKIKINGFIFSNPQAAQSAADTQAYIRLMLVQDTQTNAAQMAAATLMNGSTAATTTVCSFQNPNGFGRFRVLKDKRMQLSNLNLAGSPTTGDVIQNGWMRPFKITHNFKIPVGVSFNAVNGGTVADIIDNSWHMVASCSNVAYVPTIVYYARVAYKE